MSEYKIFKIDKDSAFFESIMDMGRGALRLKKEFAEKTKGTSLPAQHDQELEEALSDYNKQKTGDLGMDYAVTCVQDNNPQAYPRAYEHKPVIYGMGFQTMENGQLKNHTQFYLYSPIGYDGDFFNPDGVQIVTDEKEEKRINGFLFADGWSEPSFRFFDRYPVGVPLPDDYVRPDMLQKDAPKNHEKLVFLLDGESKDLVNDYKNRSDHYDQKTDAAVSCVKDIIMNDMKADILKRLEPDEGYYANISLRGKEISVSIRLEGKNNIMQAGQPLPLEDNEFFSVLPTQYGHEYKVIPNTTTKQGRALAKAIDAIPVKPSLGDYDALMGDIPVDENEIDNLLGFDVHAPTLRNIQGYDVLVYQTDDVNASDFCPEGCMRLSPAIYFWLEQDSNDAQMGISPPPAPDALLQELADCVSSPRLEHHNNDIDRPEP